MPLPAEAGRHILTRSPGPRRGRARERRDRDRVHESPIESWSRIRSRRSMMPSRSRTRHRACSAEESGRRSRRGLLWASGGLRRRRAPRVHRLPLAPTAPEARPAPSAAAPPPWEVALRAGLGRDPPRGAPGKSRCSSAEYFDRVSDAMRTYLGALYGFDGLESTTDEAIANLKRSPVQSIPLPEGDRVPPGVRPGEVRELHPGAHRLREGPRSRRAHRARDDAASSGVPGAPSLCTAAAAEGQMNAMPRWARAGRATLAYAATLAAVVVGCAWGLFARGEAWLSAKWTLPASVGTAIRSAHLGGGDRLRAPRARRDGLGRLANDGGGRPAGPPDRAPYPRAAARRPARTGGPSSAIYPASCAARRSSCVSPRDPPPAGTCSRGRTRRSAASTS